MVQGSEYYAPTSFKMSLTKPHRAFQYNAIHEKMHFSDLLVSDLGVNRKNLLKMKHLGHVQRRNVILTNTHLSK